MHPQLVLTLRAGVAGPDTINIVLNGKRGCCFCLGAPTPPHRDTLKERNPNNPGGHAISYFDMDKHHWNIPVNVSIAAGMPGQLAGRCDPAAFAEFMAHLGAQDGKRTDGCILWSSVACACLPCVMIPLLCLAGCVAGKPIFDTKYLPGVQDLLAQKQQFFCQRMGCTSIALVEYQYQHYVQAKHGSGWRDVKVPVVRLEWPPSRALASAPPPPHAHHQHHHMQPGMVATNAPACVTMNPMTR